MGEHFFFSLLMSLLLLGSFTIISLVMFWAPSTPFPMRKDPVRKDPVRKDPAEQAPSSQEAETTDG